MFKKISKLALIVFLITCATSTSVFAENCGSYFIKTSYYTFSGEKKTGYISVPIIFSRNKIQYNVDGPLVLNYYDESWNFTQQTQRKDINQNLLTVIDTNKLSPIFAINKRALLEQKSSYQVVDLYNKFIDDNYRLQIADTFYQKNVSEQQLNNKPLYFTTPNYINPDSIALMTLDSVLFCTDYDQVHTLNKEQTSIFLNQKPFWIKRFPEDTDSQYWMEFHSYGENWTQARLLNLINSENVVIILEQNHPLQVLEKTNPKIWNAIKSNELFCFVRYSP